jgi:glycosyltransferase involved in cell wall biosynthesis
MKSLLIVTELFTLGGLETHIRGEIENLTEAGVEVHLAVGKAFQDSLLPSGLTSTTHGLPLGPDCSPEELLAAIDQLRKIIRQHGIECVHVHPFTSIIPAVVAAELERVPYVITLHGPASLASYGPIYDLLVRDVILPSAPLIVAVSPEVQNLLTIHATNESVICIPNAVAFQETFGETPVTSLTDQRWLVVSRLDQFKMQGIVDFCIKARACGIPGVVIAGDGPAKKHLCQIIAEQGGSDYVELIGASTEVPSLIQRFSGVAGMGRVVLEGISARKPVVLVGYDGVKGVVDKQFLAKVAERNFSGRNLPTIDSNDFLSQLRRIAANGELSEVFGFARTHFNARDTWTRFLSKLGSLPPPVPTALTGLYHSLSGSTIDGTTPYLYSKVMLDRAEAVVCSKNYYDPRVLAAVSFCRQRQASDDVNLAVAERDGQIASLDQVVAERDGQIASLNQAVAERDGQIASLNQAVAERDGQIASLNQAVAERDRQLARIRNEADSQFVRLEQLLHSRSWQLTRPLRAAGRIIRHGTPFANGNRGLYDFAARIGRKFPFPLGLKARVRKALLERLYPHKDNVLHPAWREERTSHQEAQQIEDSTAAMRPECCGLVNGLVSVVLPVYNQADLIAESIESVLAQTYQEFELIIINDGSSDGVERVLQRYIDHPKVRCYTQANQRLPKALSNGFSFARGEFWTWTSADNIMEPQMLEMLVARLQADPTLGMVYADYYAIDDRGDLLQDRTWRAHNRPNPETGEIRLPRSTEALNVIQDNFIGPCFMYRGWIGRCLGDYDPQLGVEDYDYWMRINAFFPIAHLGDDSLLYQYRVHDNTLSAKAHEHKILEKAQRLMAYERERAPFYATPTGYVADISGRTWLVDQGVAEADISAWGQDNNTATLAVINCASAENAVSQLLESGRPVALIMNRSDTRYHNIHRLFNSGNCIVLAEDSISAERVRLLSSTCPVVDAKSGMALAVTKAFAKNLLFVRATRTAEELNRELPRRIMGLREYHVVLQVDSFTQGGMENVVIDLAISLQNNRYQVTIVNFGKSADAAAKALERGLQVVSLPNDLPDDAYGSWLLEKKVNLVNAHYSIRGAAICADQGLPFIQTIHNSYVWLDPLQIENYREADRHTTEYICVSMTAARYADVVLGLDVGKIRVVPNGIDPNAIDAASFDTNRACLRSTWGVSAEAPVFLNVASIMATKAQLPLVKAFARVVQKIPKARLVLLGAVMEVPYLAAIEKAVQELGLQQNVLFAGYDRHVSRYYHAADVFVLPSYWEGWSLSLGEAMANGLACVITDVGSAYEFEGFDGVEIVEPPFGDISLLNYRNLGDFVYGTDTAFEKRLADAMIKVSSYQKARINFSLTDKLDREMAYQRYSNIFFDFTKMKGGSRWIKSQQ